MNTSASPSGQGRKLDEEHVSRLDARADGIADSRCGPQPRARPLHLALATYAAIGIAPWIAFSAAGIPIGQYELLLVIAGLVAATAVYLWQHRRRERWQAAQRAAFEELRAAAEADGERN